MIISQYYTEDWRVT